MASPKKIAHAHALAHTPHTHTHTRACTKRKFALVIQDMSDTSTNQRPLYIDVPSPVARYINQSTPLVHRRTFARLTTYQPINASRTWRYLRPSPEISTNQRLSYMDVPSPEISTNQRLSYMKYLFLLKHNFSCLRGAWMRQPRPRASDNEWAILGAYSVLYNCSGGLVFSLHIITCFRSVIVHYCRRGHNEVIV